MIRNLKKGDKIGIFSPSSPASVSAEQRYKRGKAFLEQKEFHIVEGSFSSFALRTALWAL